MDVVQRYIVEQEKLAEFWMGIDLCSNANTKQVIKQYLTEVGVGNIQALSYNQTGILMLRV